VVKEDILGKIKALARWERKTPRKIINEALTQYLKDKEIKPIPVEDGQEQ
jgi:predicted transcriptional regulator